MSTPKIFLAFENKECHIKVKGRANFECSPPLRAVSANLDNNRISGLYVDLSVCSGMDSTFMGILAMIALKVKQLGITADIINAGENNIRLLTGLGLQKLFNFSEAVPGKNFNWDEKKSENSRIETAHTVLDAHQTLIDVDKENEKRFKNVVDFVKKDIEKEEKKDGEK